MNGEEKERIKELYGLASLVSEDIVHELNKLYFDKENLPKFKNIFGHVNLFFYHVCVFVMAKVVASHFTDGFKTGEKIGNKEDFGTMEDIIAGNKDFKIIQELLQEFSPDVLNYALLAADEFREGIPYSKVWGHIDIDNEADKTTIHKMYDKHIFDKKN